MSRKKNSYDNIVSKGERQDNGCLLYTNSQQKNGYALVSYENKMIPVHRVVYKLSGKSLPLQFDVHHICHNKLCIEITHLEALSRHQHALLSEKDITQRNQRLRELLSYYPLAEIVPIEFTSKTLGDLWECKSYNVPSLLQTMSETYSDEFFWRPLKSGRRGRKPAIFELRIMSSLVEKLLSEEATPLVENLVTQK